MVRAAELCPTADDPDKVIRNMRKWLKDEGLTELEPVTLFAEQLEKVHHIIPAWWQASLSSRRKPSR